MKDDTFYRNEKGNLVVNSLNLQILLDDIFLVAKTQKEVKWIEEVMNGHIEAAREEASGYLE